MSHARARAKQGATDLILGDDEHFEDDLDQRDRLVGHRTVWKDGKLQYLYTRPQGREAM